MLPRGTLEGRRMIRFPSVVRAMAAAFTLLVAPRAMAQAPPPDAAGNDPVALGWMVGSPPPPERTIAHADGSFYAFPQLRWSFSHWRQLGPTVAVMRLGGRWQGRQVIPAPAIADIRAGADREQFKSGGYSLLPGWSYRSQWWISHDDHGAFAARGVHGQGIYVDPKAEMVVARFASHPVAGNAAIDPTTLPAYRALAEHLLRAPRP